MLELRDYQIQKINEVAATFKEGKQIPVLAMCPGAGKTVTSLEIIKRFIEKNKNSRVLVLTHGTTVLRNQYYNTMSDPKFKGYFNRLKAISCKLESGTCSNTDRVVITLPQTLRNIDLKPGDFDLIVVDEAHQFYLANSVQNIINTIQPKQQLLLTGTPANLILENDRAIANEEQPKFNILSVALLSIIDEMAELDIEVAASAYKLSDRDYNQYGEVLEASVAKSFDNKRQTYLTTESFIKSMADYLTVSDKTMIMCKSIKQAAHVEAKLRQLGHSVISSNQATDINNENIAKFKNTNDYRFLIVVGRGILGFDDPKLTGFVDMSGTRNLGRIYQALARVIRKDNDNPDRRKKFIKIAASSSEAEIKYTVFLMNTTVGLADETNITRYNGTNSEIIPVLVKSEDSVLDIGSDGLSESKERPEPTTTENRTPTPINFGTMIDYKEYLQILTNPKDARFGIYARTNIKEITRLHTGGKNIYWTYEKIQTEALKYKTRGEFHKGSKNGYQAARSRNILDEVCSHMKAQAYTNWTKEMVQVEALKYKARGEFKEGNKNAYNTAIHHGILDDVCSHMKAQHKSWTKEMVQVEALKYKTKMEFSKGSNNAYQVARRLNILDDVCSHMDVKYKSFDESLELLKHFIVMHNRRPNQRAKDKDERSIGIWLAKKRRDPQVIELLKKIKKKYN